MDSFHRMAKVATIATYILIFIGGLVRVSGAGLGCPDWPRCFGRWIPPTSVDQLPAYIDPSLFNFTLAWIEYFNRLAGVTVGLLILATAIMSIRIVQNSPKLTIATWGAGFLTAFQGWQGSIVVSSELEPIVVSVHMAMAIIIVCLLTYVTQQSYYKMNPEVEKAAVYPKKIYYWIGIVWVLGLIQIILGAQLRGAIELLFEAMPLDAATVWANRVGPISHMHELLGIIVIGGGGHIGARMLVRSKNPSPLAHTASWALLIVLAMQFLLGMGMLFMGHSPIFSLLHLWCASLFAGIILILYFALKQQRDLSHE